MEKAQCWTFNEIFTTVWKTPFSGQELSPNAHYYFSEAFL